jgi:hypothetical protein
MSLLVQALIEHKTLRQVHLVSNSGEHIVLDDHEYEELARYPSFLHGYTVCLTGARALELVARRRRAA